MIFLMPNRTSRVSCLYHTADLLVTYPFDPQPVSVLSFSPGRAFSVSFSINSCSACLLNAGVSLSPLLNTWCSQPRWPHQHHWLQLPLMCPWLPSHLLVTLPNIQLSLGEHFKLRMPIMNSSSFFQQPHSLPKFSVSMKGRASTKWPKAKTVEVG